MVQLSLHWSSLISRMFQLASPRPQQPKVSATWLWQASNYGVLPQTSPQLCLSQASVNSSVLPLGAAYPTAEGQ